MRVRVCDFLQGKGMLTTFWLIGKDPSLAIKEEA